MKKLITFVAVSLVALLLFSCLDSLSSVLNRQGPPKAGLDEKTIIAGLKEALNIGTKNAVNFVSKKDGYFKNARISIPLPQELKDVGDTLRRIGLGKKV